MNYYDYNDADNNWLHIPRDTNGKWRAIKHIRCFQIGVRTDYETWAALEDAAERSEEKSIGLIMLEAISNAYVDYATRGTLPDSITLPEALDEWHSIRVDAATRSMLTEMAQAASTTISDMVRRIASTLTNQ